MTHLTYGDLILGPDTTANRPAANAVADGTLYVNTDTDVVERSNGVDTWSEWFDPEEPQ
jgi:hypothetical protein